MSEWTDTVLRRRPPQFFVGKVLHMSSQVPEATHGPGYYRCRYDTQWWYYDWIGTEMPEGEPVYKWHTPGQLDLCAVPRTVFPKSSFWGWGIVTLACIIFSTIVSHEFLGAVGMFLPMWIAAVGLAWLSDIEPVFATKVMLAAVAAWSIIRSHSERTHQQVVNDQRNREMGRPGPSPIHAHWDAIHQKQQQRRDEVRQEVRQYLREQGRGW